MTTTRIEMRNGLPLEEFGKVPEALGKNSEEGMLTFATRTVWKGGMRSTSEVDGFEAGGQPSSGATWSRPTSPRSSSVATRRRIPRSSCSRGWALV